MTIIIITEMLVSYGTTQTVSAVAVLLAMQIKVKQTGKNDPNDITNISQKKVTNGR